MIRIDLTVATVAELATVHVASLKEGANSWVDAEGEYFTLELNSGATPGVNVVAPLVGSPIAGAANARWIRQTGGGGTGSALFGLLVNRPTAAAANAGFIYYATDAKETFLSTQTGVVTFQWDLLWPVSIQVATFSALTTPTIDLLGQTAVALDTGGIYQVQPLGLGYAWQAFVYPGTLPTVVAVESLPGPPTRTITTVEEFSAQYQFIPGDSSTVDGFTVLSVTGGNPGRWKVVGAQLTLTPLGSGLDDWPRVINATNAMASIGGSIRLVGTFSAQTSAIQTANNGRIFGTPKTSKVVSTLSPTGVLFTASPITDGSTYTIVNDIALGVETIVVNKTIPAGSFIAIFTSSNLTAGLYITGTPTSAGGGNFNIPLDRPTLYAYPSVSSTMQVYASNPSNIVVDGLTLTGTGLSYVKYFGAYQCEFKNIVIDNSGGSLNGSAPIAMLYDSASFLCTFTSVKISGQNSVGSTFGIFVAGSEQCTVQSCSVGGCSGNGIQLSSSADCDVLDCHAYENVDGINFSSADSVNGCVYCRVTGGSFNGNTNGAHVSVGSQYVKIANVDANYNTQIGIYNDSTTIAPIGTSLVNATTRGNGNIGISNAVGCKGTIGANLTVPDNFNDGILSADDATWENIVSRGNAGGSAVQSVFRSIGGKNRVRGVEGQSALSTWKPIQATSGLLVVSDAHLTCDDATTFPKAFSISGTAVLHLSECVVDGAHSGTQNTGLSAVSTNSITIGRNVDFSSCAVQYNTSTAPITFGGPNIAFGALTGVVTASAQLVPPGSGATTTTTDTVLGVAMANPGFISNIRVQHTGSVSNVAGQTITYQLQQQTGGGAPVNVTGAVLAGVVTTAGVKTSSVNFVPVKYAAGDIFTLLATPSALLTAAVVDQMGVAS